jgi:hypothetical protein
LEALYHFFAMFVHFRSHLPSIAQIHQSKADPDDAQDSMNASIYLASLDRVEISYRFPTCLEAATSTLWGYSSGDGGCLETKMQRQAERC